MNRVPLNEKDLNLLGIVELQGDLTIDQLARLTSYKSHTIQYSLQKLKEKGVLSERRPMIDLHGLGYTHHTIFFSLASRTAKMTQQFLKILQDSEYITWAFETAGRYQYAISIAVRHTSDVAKFLKFLGESLGDAIVEKTICTQLDFEYYGRRYLLSGKHKTPTISFQFPTRYHSIDKDEEKILSVLANESPKTVRELAKMIGMPAATVDRKKRNLEERGVIQGYFHWISSAALGRQPYIFRIVSHGLPTQLKSDLISFSRKDSSVLYFIECIGPWDFELGVELGDTREVTLFIQQLYDRFGKSVRSIQPIPVLDYFKVKSYPQSGSSTTVD